MIEIEKIHHTFVGATSTRNTNYCKCSIQSKWNILVFSDTVTELTNICIMVYQSHREISFKVRNAKSYLLTVAQIKTEQNVCQCFISIQWEKNSKIHDRLESLWKIFRMLVVLALFDVSRDVEAVDFSAASTASASASIL